MQPSLLFFLQAIPNAQPQEYHGTGREWLVFFSILVPLVLLLVLAYVGNRRTVH